jgi:hypothetical protein
MVERKTSGRSMKRFNLLILIPTIFYLVGTASAGSSRVSSLVLLQRDVPKGFVETASHPFSNASIAGRSRSIARYLRRLGRLGGYETVFTNRQRRGEYRITDQISEFRTPEGAQAWVNAYVSNAGNVRWLGASFKALHHARVGDRSYAFVWLATYHGSPASSTLLLFNTGRFVATVRIEAYTDQDELAEAAALGRIINRRLVSAGGKVVPPRATSTPLPKSIAPLATALGRACIRLADLPSGFRVSSAGWYSNAKLLKMPPAGVARLGRIGGYERSFSRHLKTNKGVFTILDLLSIFRSISEAKRFYRDSAISMIGSSYGGARNRRLAPLHVGEETVAFGATSASSGHPLTNDTLYSRRGRFVTSMVVLGYAGYSIGQVVAWAQSSDRRIKVSLMARSKPLTKG